MLACEIQEWAKRCADECDAERERIVRIAEAGGELPLQQVMLLSQVSFACYGLEALAKSMQELDTINAGGY